MRTRHYCAIATLVFASTAAWGLHAASADTPVSVGVNVEVLTRGPVHEAFAEVVVFDPEPGPVLVKAPPLPIEEVIPDERPEGDTVVWVPGYSAWDDDRRDYVWVSGVWRDVPPGRQWISGYWSETGAGFQWTDGYWAGAQVAEVEYLPAPPPVVEIESVVAAPSPNHTWVPGCWVWQGRYVWRPGQWVVVHPDWDWVPAHYVWTPRGYVFVDGYWDYTVKRRGVLFAPVYFDTVAYSRPDFYYTPATVIDVDVFSEHLFVRSRCSHYYFGDYYEVSYHHAGFEPAFSLHVRRGGYDPIYTRMRYLHRHEHDWHDRLEANYAYRRVNVGARPPRTLSAQLQLAGSGLNVSGSLVMAKSFDQAKASDANLRFTRVAPEEMKALAHKSREVRKFSTERKRLEANASTSGPKSASRGKAMLPASPIAARTSKASIPPSRPKSPMVDPTVAPQPRKTAAGKSGIQREPANGGNVPRSGAVQKHPQRTTNQSKQVGKQAAPVNKQSPPSKAPSGQKAAHPSADQPGPGPDVREAEGEDDKPKAKSARPSKNRTQRTKSKDKP